MKNVHPGTPPNQAVVASGLLKTTLGTSGSWDHGPGGGKGRAPEDVLAVPPSGVRPESTRPPSSDPLLALVSRALRSNPSPEPSAPVGISRSPVTRAD